MRVPIDAELFGGHSGRRREDLDVVDAPERPEDQHRRQDEAEVTDRG